MVRVFIPWKLANTTNTGLFFCCGGGDDVYFPFQKAILPAYQWLNLNAEFKHLKDRQLILDSYFQFYETHR